MVTSTESGYLSHIERMLEDSFTLSTRNILGRVREHDTRGALASATNDEHRYATLDIGQRPNEQNGIKKINKNKNDEYEIKKTWMRGAYEWEGDSNERQRRMNEQSTLEKARTLCWRKRQS